MTAIKIIITILISAAFAYLAMAKIKAGLALSVAIAFVPIAWIFLKRIEVKYFLYIFFILYPLLPAMAGIPIAPGIPILHSHRIAILILLLFLLSNGLLIKYYGYFFKARVFTFNVLLVIASHFITSFLSYNFQSTLFYTLSYVFESLIISVVVFSAFETREEVEILVKALIISGAILCVFGLLEKATSYNFYTAFGVFDDNYSLTHQMRGGEIRVYGPFEHSIAYAAYLTAILPLFLYKFRDRIYLFSASVALILLAILASQSRSGVLGVAIIFFFYFIFINKKSLIFILILMIPVALYKIEGIIQFLIDLNPYTTTQNELALSANARGSQIDFLLGVIKQNFVFGYGLVSSGLDTVDNFYLGKAFHFGLVGLISYLLLIIVVITKPIILFGRQLLEDTLLLLLIVAIFSLNVINWFVFLPSYHFIMYIYIGIIARLCYNAKSELMSQQSNK